MALAIVFDLPYHALDVFGDGKDIGLERFVCWSQSLSGPGLMPHGLAGFPPLILAQAACLSFPPPVYVPQAQAPNEHRKKNGLL